MIWSQCYTVQKQEENICQTFALLINAEDLWLKIVIITSPEMDKQT